jgi:hypothetical protein
MGRIWRVTHEGMEPDRRQPRMYQETAAGLVVHLEHPNGWWRDTAQKLLVLRQDESVVPALQALARTGRAQLGRIHALWRSRGCNAAGDRGQRQRHGPPPYHRDQGGGQERESGRPDKRLGEFLVALREALTRYHGFAEAQRKQTFAPTDVAAGREYVEAYVQLVHFAEVLEAIAAGDRHPGHGGAAPHADPGGHVH